MLNNKEHLQDLIINAANVFEKNVIVKVDRAIDNKSLDNVDIRTIYNYAMIKKEPIDIIEEYIARDAKHSFMYQENVLNKPFTEPGTGYIFHRGINAISKHPKYAYQHAYHRLDGRFIEGEEAIANDAWFSYLYAVEVLRERFHIGEPAILGNIASAYQYKEYFFNGF